LNSEFWIERREAVQSVKLKVKSENMEEGKNGRVENMEGWNNGKGIEEIMDFEF
jgi:hypothetical protein